MILSAVSDEIDLDFSRAVRTGTELGISNYEIRCVWNSRFPYIDGSRIKLMKSAIRDCEAVVSAVSPGLFKVELDSEEMKVHTGAMLDDTMRLAEDFGARKIIIFGVKRSDRETEADYPQVLETLGRAVRKMSDRGFTVCVENEPGWWTDTSKNTFRVLRDLENAGLRLNWDPGNLFAAGERDYKPGYELLKKYNSNVHVKDAEIVGDGSRWVPLGKGQINWKGQLEDLKKDGYAGNISLETHCEPLLEATKISAEYLKKWL